MAIEWFAIDIGRNGREYLELSCIRLIYVTLEVCYMKFSSYLRIVYIRGRIDCARVWFNVNCDKNK